MPSLVALSMFSALLVGQSAGAVELGWVAIGDPGNPADTEVVICCHGWEEIRTTGLGSVAYTYRIPRTEISNTQYVEFLNAVAADDPNGLWPGNPPDDGYGQAGGIERTGEPGSYSYQPVPGMEQKPVRWMHWYRAARFCNWLHNWRPSGPQDASTTEDGAYTLLGANPPDVQRNPWARYWIPNEDEWYKAAYYDPVLHGYWDYPVRTDEAPLADLPPGGPFSVNLSDPPPNGLLNACPPENTAPCALTDVGAYVDALSPYGTQDQAGNVWEILEERVDDKMLARGGNWHNALGDSAAFVRTAAPAICNGCGGTGFRVARTLRRTRCGLGFELALLFRR